MDDEKLYPGFEHIPGLAMDTLIFCIFCASESHYDEETQGIKPINQESLEMYCAGFLRRRGHTVLMKGINA